VWGGENLEWERVKKRRHRWRGEEARKETAWLEYGVWDLAEMAKKIFKNSAVRY
jgi:hypothetical protein